ncbi:MAG: hypothetical protein V7K90_31215 [Nostoc sp.]|uniref:hypothetical protein n=1 Tax=Nostoc sp. TaxID=1180 RepID=UPI002FF7943E
MTTHKRDGSFDFYSNIIEIERYDSRYKDILEGVLRSSPESLTESWHTDALSLYFHEVTHFLDLTTTGWGLEYILRKHLVLKKIGMNKAVEKSLKVFMLNTSEIQMHSDLIKCYEDRNFLDCSLNHDLKYSEKYGVLIEIYFFYGQSHIATVPLSMLSVLEANAYASEILCKLRFLEGHADENVEVSLRLLESEVNSYLNNKAFSEYSLLLILCKIHFEYLTLKEMLIFFQLLVFRVLNMQIMNLSFMSAFLKRTFKNNHYGRAICKDMQRGMSRHIVVFKLILLVHQFINESSDKLSLIALMKEKPDEVINLMFKYYEINIISELDFGNNSQFYLILENILNEDDMFDKNIIAESSEFNHKVIKEKGWSKVDLSDLKILDSLLSDGSVIRFPDRVSLDVNKYFDNNIDKFLIIEHLFKNTEVSKFHIHPDHVVWV